IARELIIPLVQKADHAQVVESVIDIAKTLDIEALAEGVETEDMSQMLDGLGCPLQQGFFHGKPKSGNALLSTLKVKPEISAAASQRASEN
ncbi:MAG: EAL domain-containing protein, partial [Pseudomonadota bacterium]